MVECLNGIYAILIMTVVFFSFKKKFLSEIFTTSLLQFFLKIVLIKPNFQFRILKRPV